MEKFETIWQISVVLTDPPPLPPPMIFDFLTEVFVAISSLTRVPINFLPRDFFRYSGGQFFGLIAFYRHPNFYPGFSIF